MRRLLLIILVFLGGIFFVPALASADVNDFTVTDFTADYYLGKSDPQGSLSIDEKITVDFTDYNHGILRALPKKYNGQDEHLSITSVTRDGASEPFTTYASGGNKVLKIGDASSTITGTHTYEIKYRVQNVIRFVADHDEFDWNTNGTEWSQPFDAETARLHMSQDLLSKMGNLRCYTGVYKGMEQSCTISRTADGAVAQTTRLLQPGETMTVAADFPLSTFQKPTAADWWRDRIGTILAIGLPILLSFIIGYRKWHRDGKDLKGRGTVIPEYAPPDGVRPAEADAILHYQASQKSISATIIDFAIRGHLKIVETTSKGVLGMGKHKEYRFEKTGTGTSDLSDYELTLYNGLFAAGDSVTTKDLKDKFYKDVKVAQSQISARLVDDGYVPKGQMGKGGWLWILGVVELIVAGVLHSYVSVGFVVGAVLVFVFAALMPKRTQKGVDAKDTLAGLKMYMETAEKDRLAMLQSPDAPYAPKSDAPEQTVQLFEKLLPYAIVLGVEKQWAKQFESIYTTPPDWYSGNWTAFNAGYLVGSLNESMSAMNTSFAAPGSSGSGGGGGFAGGGGGGGGGGGW